jgi:probable F420-dependent oxidoreductase
VSPRRYGITLPLDSIPLVEHGALLTAAEARGYTDAWTGEVDTFDGFVPLAVAALATSEMRLGTGVVNPYTRGVGALAISAAAIADLAPGRFCLGIGSSSNVIVERWNGVVFEKPLARVRDAVDILRLALAGERVEVTAQTISIRGLRLGRPPTEPVPIFLAALRPRMLRLAGEKADGVLLNWLGPMDVPKAIEAITAGSAASGRAVPEIACRVFVIPGDPELADVQARRFIAAYLTVPVYAGYQRWLGRGVALAPMVEAWQAGNRVEAVELVPSQVVDDLLLCRGFGPSRSAIESYFRAGVNTIILHVLPTASEPAERRQQVIEVVEELAPRMDADVGFGEGK